MYRNNGGGAEGVVGGGGISGALQTKVIELGSVDTRSQTECPCCGTHCARVCYKAQPAFVLCDLCHGKGVISG